MRKTSKLLALLLACVLVMSLLASCAGDGSTNTNTDTNTNTTTDANTGDDVGSDDTTGSENNTNSSGFDADRPLKLVAMQDSGTLSPLGVTGGFIQVLNCFYEPLFDTKADGSRIWILGTGLERISDIQYTLTIREGVTFSNGNPLTAEDVMYTMELCRDNPQFSLNVKVVDFEKTKVTGDYTIDLWYTEYNAAQEPGLTQLLIMDKESYDEVSMTRTPIGTGPYVVTDYVVNSHLNVTARDDYWGESAKIKNIEFKVINEDAQIINALETGDVDMASAIPIKDAAYVESLGYEVRVANSNYTYVAMYSMLPGNPLESKEARWAVSLAIDRQAIADILLQGLSTVTNYPASQHQTDYEDRFANMHETYSDAYNIERAKELADQSGLTGKTIRIITNGSSAFNTIAEIIQADLLNIDVNAEIVSYDQATYFGTMMDATNFEIAIFNPATPTMLACDVVAMYLTFISLGWTGPERDLYGELSMGALAIYDDAARGDKLYEVLQMFTDYTPWYALCEVVGARGIAPYLTGVEFMIAGNIYYHTIEYR